MKRFELCPQGHRILRNAFGVLLGAFLVVGTFTLGSASAVAQFAGPTQLTFVNGWTDAPFGTSHAMVQEALGIVQFRGAIAGGTSGFAFTLPAALSPGNVAYVPVDLCNANKGRLIIEPNGQVFVQAEKTFADAQCFTSLDGASFEPKPTGFTNLGLINGWIGAPFSTATPAAKVIGQRVHFRGAIATSGANPSPFTMPPGFRPSKDVYIEVDLCNANKGRLHITPAGVVTVQAENGTFTNAQCFTSLDGAWYAFSTANFTPITPLMNGWSNAPFSTSSAEAFNAYGVVYLKGAIGSGSSAQVFTLSTRFRPVTNIYVPIDLCNANKGRLFIQTSGVVLVQAELGTPFSNAQCFTSLDGVSFVQ
jgi:hypothetical protein